MIGIPPIFVDFGMYFVVVVVDMPFVVVFVVQNIAVFDIVIVVASFVGFELYFFVVFVDIQFVEVLFAVFEKKPSFSR